MIYTLSKTDKKEPGPTEAIFFTKPKFEGDAYIAYVGYVVDFGKGLKDIPDSLNDHLHSVKTGNICKLELFEDYGLLGDNIAVPADSDLTQIPLGLTSFKAELDLDANIKDELTQCELDKINYEKRLEECVEERKEFKNKLAEYENLLRQYKDKLTECEKNGKDLKDQLDKRKLEDEVKKIKDKLDDCEKKGKDLQEQLDKSEQEKNDYKEKLDEYDKK
ncbi:hypothetical protein [Rickettsiella endosymbiont of Aleochara curtula]|uniref:hypothetical protein n=1 Tax=Rickettsiella endosymbiont of Aleochara curtula TaxID=3077936 RepID=UPI00313E1007